MDYWIGVSVGIAIGVPFGWVLLIIGFVRWTVNAAEEGENMTPARRGSVADRKKGEG